MRAEGRGENGELGEAEELGEVGTGVGGGAELERVVAVEWFARAVDEAIDEAEEVRVLPGVVLFAFGGVEIGEEEGIETLVGSEGAERGELGGSPRLVAEEKGDGGPTADGDEVGAWWSAGGFGGFGEGGEEAERISFGEIHPGGDGEDAAGGEALKGVGERVASEKELFGGGSETGGAAECADVGEADKVKGFGCAAEEGTRVGARERDGWEGPFGGERRRRGGEEVGESGVGFDDGDVGVGGSVGGEGGPAGRGVFEQEDALRGVEECGGVGGGGEPVRVAGGGGIEERAVGEGVDEDGGLAGDFAGEMEAGGR